MTNLNTRKIEKQLEKLYAEKTALIDKRQNLIKDLDERIRITDGQIRTYEKIKNETEKLIRSAEEQMKLADELMSQGKNKEAEKTDALPVNGENYDNA